jgi:hypothetical protein
MIRKAYNTHARLSVRDDLTDTKPTRGRIPPALRRAAALLARVDWQRLFQTAARSLTLFCTAVDAAALAGYVRLFGFGALVAVGQFLTACCFLAVAFLTDEDGIVLLMGGLSILLTLTF